MTSSAAGRRRPGRSVIAFLVALLGIPLANLLAQSPAAAATPTLVQSAAGSGSNATVGSTVTLSASLPAVCTTGDTLVAMVTVAQDAPGVGLVSATPSGWQRLYEHTPTTLGSDRSPYQGWFALSACSGVQTVSFAITSPGNPLGTSGSLVVGEYSGLPDPVAVDFATNGGSGTASTSGTLAGSTPAASSELTLTALSFYGSSPSSSTPTGWTAAGSESSTLPAFVYWRLGTSSAPSASFAWSPSSSYEMSMIALKAGPTGGAPNVVQETQGAFSGQSSWQLSLTTGVRAGDALVAMVGTSVSGTTGAGYEATAISGGGVIWQKVAGFVQSGNGTAEVWAGFGSSGTSGSTAVTVSLAASATGTLVLSEVSGIESVDTSSTADGSSSTPTAGAVTPQAGDLVLGFLTTNPTSVALHPSPTWSTFSVPAASYAAEWLTDAPGVSSSPQWTTSPAGAWVTVQAAFSSSPASGTNPVGSMGSASGTGVTTLADDPVNTGDLEVLGIKVSSSAVDATAVSGGGVETWTKLTQHADTSDRVDTELWMGQVMNAGPATISVTFSASVTSIGVELVSQEFNSGLALTAWAADTTGGQTDASSTTVAYPSLTPKSTDELYVGYAWVLEEGEPGSTAGVSYDIVPTSDDVFLYDTNVSGALAPAATQAPAGTASAVGALVSASGTAYAPPTVTSLSPSSGVAGGGNQVVIGGTNFAGTSAVYFGSALATNVEIEDTNILTVTAPAGSGTVNVTVTTPAGTSAVSTADQYTYLTPPAVSGLGTSSGTTSGGTSVAITGTNLSGATAVMFGAVAATGFTVNGPNQITATSPAEPAWSVDVTVTTPGGTSATSPADTFTFDAATPTTVTTPHVMVVMMENEEYSDVIGAADAPNITHLAQAYGVATQSYSIGHPSLPNYLELLAGSNYGVNTDETPQQANLSASDSTLVSELDAAGIPWRAYLEDMPSDGYTGGDTDDDPYGGVYYLQHHNPFVYFPAVTSLADFDTNVVPLSTNFTSDLDSGSPPAFVWVTPNAVDDMHDGPADLSDGDTVPTLGDTWLAGFIGEVQSTPWYAAGGQIVVEWDEGADSDTSGVGSAGLGGGGHIPTLVVSAALQASPRQDATPVNTAGVLRSLESEYDMPFLEDSGATANGNIDGLLSFPAPTVSGISPTSGSTSGGTSVTITGANFTSGSTVDFGTTAATAVTVNSPTSITATAPAGTGSVNVTVTTPGGTATAPEQFSYTSGPAFSAVGSLADAHGTDITTLAASPQHVGDVLVLAVKVSSSSITVSSVSGGGASSWTRLTQHTDTSNGVDVELWMGPVTTTGSSTISVSFSGSVTSTGTELAAQEFSSGLSGTVTWSLDKAGSQTDASSTTVAFPSLAPAKTPELYVGYAWVLQEGEAGSTAGVTYDILPSSDDVFLYDPTVSATLAPAATQAPAGTASVVGALLSATG